MLLVAACAAAALLAAPAFLAPPRAGQTMDPRFVAAASVGLSPLALEQPAGAFDSVVAMLQSWLVGGSVMVLIFAAVLIASSANPLTKRRQEAAAMMNKKGAVRSLWLGLSRQWRAPAGAWQD